MGKGKKHADTTLPIERAASNIIRLGANDERATAPAGYDSYTRMYKRHPIVRAAIDKIAKACVATGYAFGPRVIGEAPNESNVTTLRDTFWRSHAPRLLHSTYVDLLIYGDAYWFITKSRKQVPFSFMRQHPATVTVVVDKTSREVTSFITRDLQGNESQYGPDEFLHFKINDPDNDVYGLSPLTSLELTVAQDLQAAAFNLNFWENSAQTGVVFNMRNASKEEVDRNREFLRKSYVGVRNAHKPLLLEGDVTVQKSVAGTPQEMQFLDGRKLLQSEILAVFDLPYTKLGGTSESANRSQSAENDKSFRSETVVPLQSIVEEVINEDLIFTRMTIEDITFAHKDVDERAEKERMEIFTEGMDRGGFTVNEMRASFGYGPVEGGDVPYINSPLGIQPLTAIMKLAELAISAKEKGLEAANSEQPTPRPNDPNRPEPDAPAGR